MALDGKHALITGSSRGIGRGIALALAADRVKLAIHYYQNEAAAKETLAEVRKRGSDGVLVQADVTRPEPIIDMFREVQAEFGKLDIFVSNARPEVPAFFQPPLDITLKQWDTAFDSQATAFLVGVREALPLMGDGGRIFAITYATGSRRGPPTLGRHGVSEGGAGVSRSILCRRRREARHHGERNQPRMDGRQRLEHVARAGAATHPDLARARLDPDGPVGNARRCRQRGSALLLGTGPVDHGPGGLRRRWRVLDEPRGSARNPDRIAAAGTRVLDKLK
jgi:NAD(P)-dependent dehydrogenase (short-subunit alcohol dehydrogenase family)